MRARKIIQFGSNSGQRDLDKQAPTFYASEIK